MQTHVSKEIGIRNTYKYNIPDPWNHGKASHQPHQEQTSWCYQASESSSWACQTLCQGCPPQHELHSGESSGLPWHWYHQHRRAPWHPSSLPGHAWPSQFVVPAHGSGREPRLGTRPSCSRVAEECQNRRWQFYQYQTEPAGSHLVPCRRGLCLSAGLQTASRNLSKRSWIA